MAETIPVQRGRTEYGQDRARTNLTPIAPPSILGLYGFGGATFIVAAYEANWYGGVKVGQ